MKCVGHIAKQFIPRLSLDKRNFNYKEHPDIAARKTFILFLGCYKKRHCVEETTKLLADLFL